MAGCVTGLSVLHLLQSQRTPSPGFTWALIVLIHVTCTSLITQSTQHYKGTHPTPALGPISFIWSGLSLLFTTAYLKLTCLCTYLLFRSIVDSLDLHRLLHSVDHPTSPPPASWGVCCSSASTSSWQDKPYQYILSPLHQVSKTLLTSIDCLHIAKFNKHHIVL